jgi:nucleoprotein TPR
MAHAETVKAMNQMKEKLLKVQADARDSQTAAETAQANLARSEASWQTQKEALDKEMADLNARNQDLVAQNEALHHHLEAISKKATTIHSHVSEASAQAPAAETNGLGGEALAELHSVLAYVRREKEIADLQLDLNKQENARLKSQIEHLVKNLEETRALLSQVRVFPRYIVSVSTDIVRLGT